MPPSNDQLFRKRKTRKVQDHKRRMACRDPYDMVLIVCEGEKTEPNYFKSLVRELQLSSANVKIADNTTGSSPRSVVEHALKTYRKKKEHDKVFCVIDKDNHQNYDEALDMIARAKLGRGHEIQAITSVPCFEYWILLHYVYTTKNYYTGPGSVCGRLITDLKTHIPDYAKGHRSIYDIVKERTDDAIRNADIVLKHCQTGGTDNPGTKVHERVKYLKELKARSCQC